MTSTWTLEWKIFKYAVSKPCKDIGSTGCVCHTLKESSSHKSPGDRPSAASSDAVSLQKTSLVQGAFCQTRYPPAVPVWQQEQDTEILLPVPINARVWLSVMDHRIVEPLRLEKTSTIIKSNRTDGGAHFSSSWHAFPRCRSTFWIPASILVQEWLLCLSGYGKFKMRFRGNPCWTKCV